MTVYVHHDAVNVRLSREGRGLSELVEDLLVRWLAVAGIESTKPNPVVRQAPK
jgi:hypothetical protein